MGMIFQNYALWPHMTVAANIAYGLKLRKKSKEEIKKKVDELLKLVHLEGEGEKYPLQLSGGQQQRVALARALAIEPNVLLCDEPLSNLDYKLRVELRSEIRDIAKTLGVTVVYVTHDQSEALSISDRIAVLNNGVISQIGTPIDIYQDPDNLFVAGFIGENSQFKGEVTKITSDFVELKLSSGDILHTMISDELSVGDKVEIMVRPDALEFEPQTTENVIVGILRHSSYMGTYVQVEMDLSDGSKLSLNEYEKIIQAANAKPGEKIKVHVPPDEIFVFKNGQRVR